MFLDLETWRRPKWLVVPAIVSIGLTLIGVWVVTGTSAEFARRHDEPGFNGIGYAAGFSIGFVFGVAALVLAVVAAILRPRRVLTWVAVGISGGCVVAAGVWQYALQHP